MISPEDWLRELRHSWPVLRSGRTTEISTVPLPLGRAGDLVRVGVDGAGARHLLVLVEDEEVRVNTVEATLRAELRTYTFNSAPRRYVDISCSRPDLFDLFDEVLVDVLTAVESTQDAPARASIEVVNRWRDLLATHRARLLTFVARMSLFAELTVLDLATRGEELDISWWCGPLREPHDIVLPQCALEVKAVGPATSSIEVHGVRQLQPPGKPLALVLASVTEQDSGTSLPELVERVLRRVGDRGAGIRLLAASGYVPADASHYQERFAVTELVHIEVTDRVPRIVPESFGSAGVPQGVEGVTYRVELHALNEFSVRGETALLSWVEEKR